VKRQLSIAVVAVTIVAGVAGCSNGNKASGPPSSSAMPSSTGPSAAASSSTPAAAAGETKVIVDGKPQNVSGPVVCATNNGKFSIAIGEAITGVIVGLEPDASVVHDIGLGSIDGVVLSFTEGAPGNSAGATKNANSYHITGTATGMDNMGLQVSKAFTIDATCP
jgi:ipoprotein LpqH